MARWAEDTERPLTEDSQQPFTLPARYYTDEAVLAAERDRFFRRSWQYVGDAGRAAEPGAYFRRDIAGHDVIVVRDEDGRLTGLHNVCAHRGSRILDDDAGECRRLQCPYHGWTYRLDGTLQGAPNFEAGDLDPADNSLRGVRLETLGPMLFAAVDADPTPLDSVLGAIPAELDPFAIEDFRRVRTVEYAVDCNWKVYVDNYLECDHCHLNHPSFVDSLDMDDYEISAREDTVLQFGDIDRDSDMDSPYDDAVDPDARGRYVSAWIWPNTTIDVTPRSLEVARIRPEGVDSTTLVVDYYNRDGAVTEAWAEGFEFSQQVMHEDIELCERQQAGFDDGVFNQGRLGPDEHGVHRFQTLVQDRLEGFSTG